MNDFTHIQVNDTLSIMDLRREIMNPAKPFDAPIANAVGVHHVTVIEVKLNIIKCKGDYLQGIDTICFNALTGHHVNGHGQGYIIQKVVTRP